MIIFFISNYLKKENFFPNINLKKLSYYSDSNIRDSRDRNYDLNYLQGDKKLKEIEECKVINLADDKNKLIKIKDLIL